ncbi:zinc finger protein 142 isoform X2 [Mugil cephalus]|nr:zinc finger protein 142 isoform X2 [Mugil cephalus]
MEKHGKDQAPFGCSDNAKDLSDHLPTCTQGRELTPTAGGTNGNELPPVSSRPQRKRKTKSDPTAVSSSPQDEEEPKRDKKKCARKAVGKDKCSAVATAPLPSKEYLAKGSEHIYRTHTCPKCCRCFKMRSHLQEHLHIHFPDPSLQCPTCQRYFTSKSKLRVHRLREAGEKLHRCHLCDYSAVERNAIRRHLSSMHADEAEDGKNVPSFLCPTCGQGFSQSRTLKSHMKTHNVQPLTCFQDGCPFQSSLRKDLIRHAAEVHGVEAVECRHHACGAVFQSETDMEEHRRTHLAYHCSLCDFSCSNKAAFLQHQRHGHPGNEKLSCDFCPFVTFNPVEFEQHIGHLHANEKIHRCSQCSYVTSHKRGLKRHMLMHSGEKPHKCSLCDFRCRDESYLSKHMLTHSEDKNFMCAECGYVTKWKHYLIVHMRKHAGDLRYACDQCSYRCHRMDQLNSHKLRHQAKSLMCEICAYACKRKYELRNHMLAKHSGEEKPSAVFKCKYCAYTTCYRQALQNHENCKHTKLKEFRCALCSYFSFSSISLFLHKRKAHGYVPGDKAWLENYAAKERERSSTAFIQDFYIKPSVDHEPSEQPKSVAPDAQESVLPGSEDQDPSEETQANVFSVSHAVVSEPPSVNSPEQYCTLVLTTLSTTDDQTSPLPNEDQKAACALTCSDTSQEKTDVSIHASSSEEEDEAAGDGAAEQSDFDGGYEPLTNTPATPGECHTPERESNSSMVSPEQNQPSQSGLTAMKKLDKDQAEAMVLEGRVQMLVLPTEDVHRCDKCSYVACKESALKHHRQTACHARTKGHECQACGAQFKQRRGLDSHLKKKCPALPRKTRTFVGVANTCLATKDERGSKRQDEGRSSDQNEVDAQHLTNREDIVDDAHASTVSEHQQRKTNKLLKKNVASSKKGRHVAVQRSALYTRKYGKFECKLCSFSSVKLQTVQRHLSTCRERSGRRDDLSDVKDDGGNGAVRGKQDLVEEVSESSANRHILSCPSCAFKCSQKRALHSHQRKGCMKPGEVQCTTCSFVAKSRTSLTRHVLHVHKKEKFGVAKPKHLHCPHCAFSCKQERRMAQHVALKHKGAQPHRCRYCPFSTTRRYRLDEHESLHTGIGRHTCDSCDKTFGAVTKLRQHKVRIHDKRPTHFCSLCDFSGYALDDVRRHNLRCHTGALQHVCTHCDAQFSSEIALRNHCKRVHQLEACFSCKQCDFTCSSDAALKAHQQSKHLQVKCTTCQASFDTRESLEVHQRRHLPHQCQLCLFATKTRQLLAQHLLNEHEDGSSEDKPLKCSTCPFACRHQLVLEQHLRSHGSKRLYKCTDCDYSTRNKQKITWHIRIHTGEKPYSCEQCSYACTDPSRLKLHMRVHQEEKKYLCPECGYKCKWATQLKYHMTKHTGEKPYACDECEYRTNRADALRAHRDTQHCDLRPYVCEKCGKAFKTSFILKTHQRQHSSDRPYTCGLCQKSFRWPAGLRHHYLTHTKQQPFCCRHCSYRAKQKFQVVKHLQRHHPDVSVDQGVVRDSEAGGLTLKEALQGSLDERAAAAAERELLPSAEEVETNAS